MEAKNWVKGNTIGAGSFGLINLVMNKSTGELFVVKSASSGHGLESLKNEADILRSLYSPHIVRCLGHELTEKQCNTSRSEFNLLMEYMAGGSVSEIIHKFGGALAEPVVRSYTRRSSKAFTTSTATRLYTDLKCKNVLLGSTGNVKLADFSSAKRLDSSDVQTPSLSGTPRMAPEALRNEGLQPAVDIWSLGCTVIEMATGRPPKADSDSDPMSMVYRIACRDHRPEYPTGFSKERIDFLDKCLQRDPRERWSSKELLERPFISQQQSVWCSDSQLPTSVLEFGFRGGKCDEEEAASTPRKIPFSLSCCSRKFDVQETDGWIDVRSG